jgi:hypothetical protein
MIKFTASSKGLTLVGLGLEAENVRRMQAGQPVRVRLSELASPTRWKPTSPH